MDYTQYQPDPSFFQQSSEMRQSPYGYNVPQGMQQGFPMEGGPVGVGYQPGWPTTFHSGPYGLPTTDVDSYPGSGQQGFPGGQGFNQFPGMGGGQSGFPGSPGFDQFPGGGFGGFPGFYPFPGGGGQPGFPPVGTPGIPDGVPGGVGTAPTSAPPSFTPQEQQITAQAVDPGAIRSCLYRFTYVWLNNGRSFWFYPTYVGRTSVAGFRWRGFRWSYYGTDLRRIRSFQCF